MAGKSKAEMLTALRLLVREALALRSDGAPYAKLARASGAVDGYMRSLLDAGIVHQRELLALVAAERAVQGGPATGTLSSDGAFLAA